MIFYLSGTGNSLWAAKYIAKATGEKLINILDKEKYRLNTHSMKMNALDFVSPYTAGGRLWH